MSWRWRKWLTKVWNNIRLVLSLNEYITVSYTSQYIQVCKLKIKEKYISIIMNKISINHNEENQSVFVENESGLFLWFHAALVDVQLSLYLYGVWLAEWAGMWRSSSFASLFLLSPLTYNSLSIFFMEKSNKFSY